MECAWTVASSGPDEESRVDLVTRVLDVKSAEIRKRLQDAEVKLARLRQSVPLDSSSKVLVQVSTRSTADRRSISS